MLAHLQHTKLLLLCQLESFDGFDDSDSFLLERALEKSCAMLGVWILIGQEIIRDTGSRFAEHIRHHGIQGDVADGKAVLETVLLAAAHIDKLAAVSRELAQDADRLFGNEAAPHQPEAEQLADPLGILHVVLVSLDGFDPFRVDDDDPKLRLQHVENRNPVFSGGFHAHIVAVVLHEPMLEPAKVFVEGGKAFLLVLERPQFRYGHDGGNEKTLVDIDATADGVYDFHAGSASFLC